MTNERVATNEEIEEREKRPYMLNGFTRSLIARINQEQATIERAVAEAERVDAERTRQEGLLKATIERLEKERDSYQQGCGYLDQENERLREALLSRGKFIDQQESEIDKYKATIERLEEQIENPKFLESLVLDQEKRIDGEVKRLREALEYYAGTAHSSGDIARKALEGDDE